MSLPNFTAEASIGNHESYVNRKYKHDDNSITIEPAQHHDKDLIESCIADGCISTSGGRICRGWSCTVYSYGYALYNYYQYGWHILESRNPPQEP